MLGDVPLEPHRHARGLTEAATRALGAGRTDEAFRLVDRRCRIAPHPDAADHLLRAACLARLGDGPAALADLRAAHAIDPDNRTAARWLAGSVVPADRLAGARALLRNEADPGRLGEAVAELGRDRPAVARFRGGPGGLDGWIAWRGPEPIALEIGADGEPATPVILAGDPGHPLAPCLGHAAAFSCPWPDGADTVTLALDRPGALLDGSAFSRPRSRPVRPRDLEAAPAGPGRVTVVVPVFADFEATARCFRTLLADQPVTVERRIVAVDDASPDPQIAALVDALAGAGRIVLIRNGRNLGFARSVNRALALAGSDDVLLLNADTALPPGFLDRLARAAYAAPDIGTVTPLSNNGENTSLPARFVENPLPDDREIRRLDAAAAAANPGLVLDMPNGTAFCLYVRADCLRSTGPIGTEFGRGYLEDVDLCLRAAAAGFRNVCAADVYVGHAGTLSFGADKRALVVRNLRRVEEAHPGYDRLCAAFFAADPLRDAVAALETRRLADGTPVHLALVPEAADPALVAGRLESLRDRHRRVLVARVAERAGRLAVTLRDAEGGLPQSLGWSLPGPAALAAALRRLPVDGVTLLADEGLPPSVPAALAILGLTAERPGAEPPRPARRRPAPGPGGSRAVLALLAPPPGPDGFRLLGDIARLWTGREGGGDLVIVGRTDDDLRVMASGAAFVTGACGRDELDDVLARYGATALAAPAAFAPDHPDRRLALRSALPIALPGPAGLSSADLALPTDPGDPAETARRLAAWCAASA